MALFSIIRGGLPKLLEALKPFFIIFFLSFLVFLGYLLEAIYTRSFRASSKPPLKLFFFFRLSIGGDLYNCL